VAWMLCAVASRRTNSTAAPRTRRALATWTPGGTTPTSPTAGPPLRYGWIEVSQHSRRAAARRVRCACRPRRRVSRGSRLDDAVGGPPAPADAVSGRGRLPLATRSRGWR
jgi:hypothetical protein